jgi:hypothetical protein
MFTSQLDWLIQGQVVARTLDKSLAWWRSVVEWLGCSAQDLRIPGSSPGRTCPLFLHMFTSAAQLVYQRLNGVWNACDSLGIIQKE